MKLYYSPGACSLSPHIVLREAGADFTLVRVDLKAKKLEDGSDYLAVNPKGYVPALQLDNGELLTEGPAIIQYIADQHPAAGLAPAPGTLDRARLQEWLNMIATELHKSFTPMFRGAGDEWKNAALDNIRRRFDFVAQRLTTHPFLMGERFSVADAYLFTVLSWTGFVKIDMSPWPALQAFSQRVGERPAVQAALRAEGLLK
ncbi:glutathione transferase GstA [Thauera sp. 2A1]|uniref:glutathione transferase GstA n=1 Tax=Thauera sp. 2A1 TaxID=2570191 RepID=UPI0012914F67|nr:glutathione transferase GstA [Thauera sp. 2A1]KAI5914867.1 glutathione transferase GstA [Thauera sp. 2A1]